MTAGSVVAITGASSGIGAATARLLAASKIGPIGDGDVDARATGIS